MTGQRLKQELQAAVADEPPLLSGADEIIARARHQQRHRRTRFHVLGAAAATALITLSATVLALEAGPDSASPPSAGDAQEPVWPVQPGTKIGPDEYDLADQRIGKRISAAFTEYAPGMTLQWAAELQSGMELPSAIRNRESYDRDRAQQVWSYAFSISTPAGEHPATVTAISSDDGIEKDMTCRRVEPGEEFFESCEYIELPRKQGEGIVVFQRVPEDRRLPETGGDEAFARLSPHKSLYVELAVLSTKKEPPPLSMQQMASIAMAIGT